MTECPCCIGGCILSVKLSDDIITVFNARLLKGEGYDEYIPTVISGVSWYSRTITSVDQDGLRAANSITIRIPAEADTAGKEWIDPISYAAADPETVWTLKPGDIIVKGTAEGGQRPAELKQKYSDLCTVLSVTDNRRAPNAKHWKVTGQ